MTGTPIFDQLYREFADGQIRLSTAAAWPLAAGVDQDIDRDIDQDAPAQTAVPGSPEIETGWSSPVTPGEWVA